MSRLNPGLRPLCGLRPGLCCFALSALVFLSRRACLPREGRKNHGQHRAPDEFPIGEAKKQGIRNQKSEIRNQESGIRNQESGIRDQESGIRNQESGIGIEMEIACFGDWQ